MTITLEQLLLSRDNRQEHQRFLLKNNPDKTLICLTVIMPGNVKRNCFSLTVAQEALKAIKKTFPLVLDIETKDLPTGFEAYILTDTDIKETKLKCCEIEDTHPLGRLFDIDVIDKDMQPLSRLQVGKKPRKCLLCEHEARYCMRNRTHTQEEIGQYIENLLKPYVH
ncbi:MAG: citrate lyase holo-[Bacteroidales bacterium]|nr:citrate lyase holo-[acyl-carrier protein] synthase [Bacteroidales bacterium]